jgi:predicted O-methyltransferase YrrM
MRGVDQETFDAVDAFVGETILPRDEALEAAVARAEAAGLPPIQVSPPQAHLLALLARLVRARTILEFGTLGGYSTIALARELPPGGRLITLEADAKHARVATESIAAAGLEGSVVVRVGPALEALPELEDEGAGPFDLVFIDADKVNTPNYFAWALDHVWPGALIVADNVVRGGSLGTAGDEDEIAAAQRRLHEIIAADPRVDATTIQTVGTKGYDGFTLALVR